MAANSSNKRTEEAWNALLISYRENPANHTRASAASGLAREACRKAFETGWPEHAYGTTSIKLILAREQNERHKALLDAKLKVLDGEGDAEESERQNRIEARKEEHEAMGRARKNALAFTGITSRVLMAGSKAAVVLQQRAEQLTAADSAEARAILRDVSTFALRSGQLLRNTLEMQRVLTGQPIAVLGVRQEALSSNDVIEAITQLGHSLQNANADGVEGYTAAPIVDAEFEEGGDGEPLAPAARSLLATPPDDEDEAPSNKDLGL